MRLFRACAGAVGNSTRPLARLPVADAAAHVDHELLHHPAIRLRHTAVTDVRRLRSVTTCAIRAAPVTALHVSYRSKIWARGRYDRYESEGPIFSLTSSRYAWRLAVERHESERKRQCLRSLPVRLIVNVSCTAWRCAVCPREARTPTPHRVSTAGAVVQAGGVTCPAARVCVCVWWDLDLDADLTSRPAMVATTARCGIMTPLGSPVVPDTHTHIHTPGGVARSRVMDLLDAHAHGR